MEKHHYRVTLEELNAATPENPARQLQFDFGNHDDVFVILERLGQRSDLAAQEIPVLVLGLKLFGKVLMDNKENELFSAFKPHFVEFMKTLKKSTPAKA
ncbi:MAG: DUF3861 domain-containing protein [Zoogloeaceae bacterium]|jgi:hypothetical protein|nr:DUF3861 domain-containing protein [Zoogloeaceae bacterium]